jgi:hypothetical protein
LKPRLVWTMRMEGYDVIDFDDRNPKQYKTEH